MTKWQKTGLILLVLVTLAAVKISFFSKTEEPVEQQAADNRQVDEKIPVQDKNVPNAYVSIYFIGQNSNKEEVYKVVKRPYDSQKDGTKLNHAIKNLLQGPGNTENTKGIYSEIPQGTKLISLEELPDKVIINLSGNFEQGGGTDGLYKRLYQLIKTANKNTALDVYLYINGKKAEVIGGEGIMINQPLNSKSLGE